MLGGQASYVGILLIASSVLGCENKIENIIQSPLGEKGTFPKLHGYKSVQCSSFVFSPDYDEIELLKIFNYNSQCIRKMNKSARKNRRCKIDDA